MRSLRPLVKVGPGPKIQLGRSRSQLARRAKQPSPRPNRRSQSRSPTFQRRALLALPNGTFLKVFRSKTRPFG
eukprot:12100808-Alexandrium_andersonii.AAC.1